MRDERRETSVVLGAEYDDDLWEAVRTVLRVYGAVGGGASWGHAGSQEIATFTATIGDDVLLLESETYIGLTLTGPTFVVERLAREIGETLRAFD